MGENPGGKIPPFSLIVTIPPIIEIKCQDTGLLVKFSPKSFRTPKGDRLFSVLRVFISIQRICFQPKPVRSRLVLVPATESSRVLRGPNAMQGKSGEHSRRRLSGSANIGEKSVHMSAKGTSVIHDGKVAYSSETFTNPKIFKKRTAILRQKDQLGMNTVFYGKVS